MYGTAFAQKWRPEFFEDSIAIDQDAPETLDMRLIVRGMMLVLIEGSFVVEFVRRAMDADLYSKRPQGCHVFAIEVCDGAWEQRETMFLSFAGSNGESVADEIKLDFKSRLPERNGRSGQAARRDIKRHVPPMILQRSESQTRLSHDLGPHVERVAGLLPGRKGE